MIIRLFVNLDDTLRTLKEFWMFISQHDDMDNWELVMSGTMHDRPFFFVDSATREIADKVKEYIKNKGLEWKYEEIEDYYEI